MNSRLTTYLISWVPCRFLIECMVLSILLTVCGCETPESCEQAAVAAVETAPKPAAGSRPADNSKCLVCHLDFKAELISARHEKEGLGCASCHGPSVAHGGDEDNITTPDRLFGRAEIAPYCRNCHLEHKMSKAYDDFLEKWHSKRRPNGRMILDDSVCTDCHGNHAILTPDQQGVVSL